MSDKAQGGAACTPRNDPCGQSSDGHFYNCHGASPELIGELSLTNSSNAPAYPVTVGYDLATGLGSVNATNLFKAWPRPR